MPATILTQILNQFSLTVSSLSEIGEVIIAPSIPIDRETTSFPVTFIFEFPQDRLRRNQAEHYVTRVHLETWYREPEGKEELAVDGRYLEGIIHRDIMISWQTGGLHSLIQKLTPLASQRNYSDEELAVIIQLYDIEYLTAWGNPFSQEY